MIYLYQNYICYMLKKLSVEKVHLEIVLVIATRLGWWVNQCPRTTLHRGREH